jgi:hypothetical protein
MKSLTINLNPATREELYADIHPDFLAHILMEALYNVTLDIPNTMAMYVPVVDDANEYAEDPDSNVMASVEFLMEVLKGEDTKNGVDVTTPDYLEKIGEYQNFISYKLCNAIESIAQFNDLAVLMVVNTMLNLPEFKAKLNFSTTHLGDKVVFVLSGLIDL